MIVEIVSTGTELLLGQIINTNTQYLSKRLNALGFDVLYQSTVGDNPIRMAEVLKNAIQRADIVITTGGLGPTQGDITKQITAQVLGKSLYIHKDTAVRIEEWFTSHNKPFVETNLRQAMIPEGAVIIDNDCGTAPGIILEIDHTIIINLPGPPYEMQNMFVKKIIPYLTAKCGSQGIILSRVIHTCQIAESTLEHRLFDLVKSQTNPTIAFLARQGEVIIRLTAKGADETETKQLLDEWENIIRTRIDQYIIGIDENKLEQTIGELLSNNKLTIAFAESCTGGLVSSLITDIPGSSNYLMGSVVCYSNEIKQRILGVPEETLNTQGAVSEPTALYMASGIRRLMNTDIGVGITGIAGPGGATPNKPVGLVYIAIDGQVGTFCNQNYFTGTREVIKNKSAYTALDTIRRYIGNFRR